MAVSEEELLIHDSQVVCPQCLAVCHYEGGTLVVRDDSDAPYRHNATVESSANETARFCHSCGKQLPAGISFCPYCGADLSAPFDTPAASAPAADPAPAPKPVREEAPVQAPVERPRAQAEASRQQSTSSQVQSNLRTITHHYGGMHPTGHREDAMPSTAFKVIAYVVIALLLILLVFIIMAGVNVENAM